ncbi:MAG: hypothetical protein WKF66_02620 [Pedobacter sp.]
MVELLNLDLNLIASRYWNKICITAPMRKVVPLLIAFTIAITGCATVQSIIKSTLPYTATLVIPASGKANTTTSAKSSATSIDQVFGNQNGTSYIKDVRIASAKLTAYNPTSASLGMFKSVNLYISSGSSGEILVASRTDVQANIGSDLVLDIDNSRFLDNYIQGGSISVRLEYVLRNNATTDVSVKTSLSFTSVPKK